MLIGGNRFGGELSVGFASRLLVRAVVAHFVHGDGHLGIDAQGLGDRIVGEGPHHDVLSAEITDDVRCFQVGLSGRIESILAIHGAIGVRHGLRVNLTAEVALRGSNLNILIVRVRALDDAHFHLGQVANDGGHGEVRKVGSTRFEHRSHLRDGDNLLHAVGGLHSGQIESAQREVDDDLLLAARNQFDLRAGRIALANACPLLGECHC